MGCERRRLGGQRVSGSHAGSTGILLSERSLQRKHRRQSTALRAEHPPLCPGPCFPCSRWSLFGGCRPRRGGRAKGHPSLSATSPGESQHGAGVCWQRGPRGGGGSGQHPASWPGHTGSASVQLSTWEKRLVHPSPQQPHHKPERWKQPRCPLMGPQVKKTWCLPTVDMPTA